MSGFNKVILMGHLTRDPLLNTLPSGSPVCEIGLAVNRRWKDAQDQQREEVLFVDCTAFGKRADAMARYFKKGNPIQLEGHLKLERWEAEDGTHRSKIRVMVERFGFIASGGTPTRNAIPATGNGRPTAAKRTPTTKRRPTVPAEPVHAAAVSNEDIPF